MRAEGAIVRGGAARELEQPRAPGSDGAAEGLVAEHLQPVLMLLPAQQLRRALAHPLGVLAPLQTPVIEEEPQQFQIVRSQLPPQEKVASQSAIYIFHQAAGAHHLSCQLLHRLAQAVIACPQLLLVLGLTLPAPAVPFRQLLGLQYLAT